MCVSRVQLRWGYLQILREMPTDYRIIIIRNNYKKYPTNLMGFCETLTMLNI